MVHLNGNPFKNVFAISLVVCPFRFSFLWAFTKVHDAIVCKNSLHAFQLLELRQIIL